MRLTVPEKILSTDIISNTATNTVTAYSSGTTYAIGNICYEGDYVYESAKNSNTGKTPHTNAGGIVINSDWLDDGFTAVADPYWINMRTINTLAMFDGYLYTQTEKTGVDSVSIDVTYSKANCNGAYLLNMDANAVTITIKDVATTLLNSITVDLSQDLVLDEYDWCFSLIPEPLSDVYVDYGVTTNSTDTVEIVFSNTTSVAVGKIATGYAQEMGSTQWGYTTEILDYSKNTPDDYGEVSLREGKWAKGIRATCAINIADVDPIWTVLTNVRAENVVVDFNPIDTSYAHLINYGLAKELKQTSAGYGDTKISMFIQGAI